MGIWRMRKLYSKNRKNNNPTSEDYYFAKIFRRFLRTLDPWSSQE